MVPDSDRTVQRGRCNARRVITCRICRGSGQRVCDCLNGQVECTRCSKSGRILITCGRYSGRGEIQRTSTQTSESQATIRCLHCGCISNASFQDCVHIERNILSTVSYQEFCAPCQGKGRWYETCGDCGGAGWIRHYRCGGSGFVSCPTEQRCPDCSGEGHFVDCRIMRKTFTPKHENEVTSPDLPQEVLRTIAWAEQSDDTQRVPGPGRVGLREKRSLRAVFEVRYVYQSRERIVYCFPKNNTWNYRSTGFPQNIFDISDRFGYLTPDYPWGERKILTAIGLAVSASLATAAILLYLL